MKQASLLTAPSRCHRHRRRPQNFAVNVSEAQLVNIRSNEDGTRSATSRALEGVDVAFTAVFTAELLVNLYAHWLRPFLADGWNLFDSAVILLSLVALGPINMPATDRLRGQGDFTARRCEMKA